MDKHCEYCGVHSLSLRRCTGCLKVFYCSKDCQKADWKMRHMRLCKKDEKQPGTTPGDGATGKDTSDGFKRFCFTTDRLTGKTHNESFPVANMQDAPRTGPKCVVCGTTHDLKTCTRCKQVKYCSRSCQRQDWSQHKKACNVAEKLRARFPPNIDQRPGVLPVGDVRQGPIARADPSRLDVDLNYKATTNNVLLDKAKDWTKLHFPFHRILDSINDIPDEFLGMRPGGTNSVFLAYISRYHHYLRRHCIYIEDKHGAEIYVAFYVDSDNPLPYFLWSDVVPGNYICIEDPYIHFFLDGSVGIRIEEAENVRIPSISLFII